MTVPDIKLADGNQVPQVGLGLWKVTDRDVFMDTFKAAVEAGYRHFDSAQFYQNEGLLGEAMASSGLNRSDFFITTKIAVTHFGRHKTLRSFAESLSKLRTDYVDLILLHFPVPLLRKASWQALEKIKADGQARSIGVSNYTVHHLKEMEQYAKETPAINQVELHVYLQQPDLRDYCLRPKIQIEAYSPLAHAHQMNNPILEQIANKHSVRPAQVMLRYLIELKLVVIPKSVTKERIYQNIDLFSFQLDQSDRSLLKQLDQAKHTTWNPTNVP